MKKAPRGGSSAAATMGVMLVLHLLLMNSASAAEASSLTILPSAQGWAQKTAARRLLLRRQPQPVATNTFHVSNGGSSVRHQLPAPPTRTPDVDPYNASARAAPTSTYNPRQN
ncbi:hypothetical protein BS78_05G029300 [Paspalum vaginatum]|nr:hypothetical protein BS78_05G029300 [Paspalum vaginatum]